MHPSSLAPSKCASQPNTSKDLQDDPLLKEDYENTRGAENDKRVRLNDLPPEPLAVDQLDFVQLQKSCEVGLRGNDSERSVSFTDEAADVSSSGAQHGARARDLQMLQLDIHASSKRILNILEPQVQAVRRMENENTLLRAENARLNKALKNMKGSRETNTSSDVEERDGSLERTVSVAASDRTTIMSKATSAFSASDESTKANKKNQPTDVNDIRHTQASVGTALTTVGPDMTSSWISPGFDEDQAKFQNVWKMAPSKSGTSNKGRSAPASVKLWDVVTKSPVERRITALHNLNQEISHFRSPEKSEDGLGDADKSYSNRPTFDRDAQVIRFDWRRRLKHVVQSNFFEMGFGLVIVSNSIFIGLDVDYVAGHPTEDVPLSYQIVGYAYTGLFTIELAIRLIADHRGFLCPATFNESCWNYLDIVIVLSSILEAALDIVKIVSESSSNGEDEDEEGGGVNLSNLRIIRIIRITKLMRLFRIARIIKFVRALRSLILSIMSTLRSVFWSLLLLTIIIYTFAIVFCQASTDYAVEISLDSSDARLTAKEAEDLEFFWGSLAVAMYSLFMSICGGVSWIEAAQPLRLVDPLWLYIFIVYISFVYFAVLNVVTGVFCHAALESQQHDQDAMVQAFLVNKHMYTNHFQKLFKAIDADNSGTITRDEFYEHIGDPSVGAYFATLGIEAQDAWTLFRLLDEDGSIAIDVGEFVHGCLRMRGQAKSVDLAQLRHEHKALHKDVEALSHFLKEQLADKRLDLGQVIRSQSHSSLGRSTTGRQSGRQWLL